jgi:predicted RNA-binding Zn-ribbon protein involved in translation (DUF1610 family)
MGNDKLYGSYRCDSCGNPVISGERCVICERRGVQGEIVTCGYINQNPETKGGVMSKTDVIDYAEICNHAKRKRECPACAEITALRAENERLRNELYKSNLAIINDVIPPCEGDDPMNIGIIIWRKWPGEKPGKTGYYVVVISDEEYGPWRRVFYNMMWYTGLDDKITHWAEIPRPEGE